MKKQFLFILCVFYTIFLIATEDNLKFNDGIINISEYNFEKQGILELSGEVEFYWKQYLTPQDFDKNPPDTFYVPIQANWNTLTINNKLLPENGYATYRMFINTKKTDYYTISFTCYAGIKIWLDGELIETHGKLGTSKETSKTATSHPIITFKSNKDTLTELIIQLCDFENIGSYTGFSRAIFIGKNDQIFRKTSLKEIISAILFGIIFIFGVYHLFVFFFNRLEPYTLVFSILSFLFAMRILGTSTIIYAHFCTSTALNNLLAYIPTGTYSAMLMLFFRQLFGKKGIHKTAVFITLIISCFLFISTLINNSYFLAKLEPLFSFEITFSVFYLVFWGFPRILKQQKTQGVWLAYLGMIMLFLFNINDLLYAMHIIPTAYLSHYGFTSYIFVESIAMAKIYANTYKQNINLNKELNYKNKNLEKIVNKRTTEILQQKEEIQVQAEYLSVMNKELEKLSIVAEKTDNSVLITNSNGDIIWVNKGFEQMYGYSFEGYKQTVGTNIFQISVNKNIRIIVDTCIEQQTSQKYIMASKNAQGENIWVQTIITPHIVKNQLEKIIFVETDITELKKQQAEIEKQKGKVERKQVILEHAISQLEHKNKQITDSIIYAERIQKAILPTNEMISQSFADYFILFKPKDIVSGDFYWYYKIDDTKSLIAAIDCTGHGVPGAFMSLIGYSLLEHIMSEYNNETAGQILDKLKYLLIDRLSKQNKNINDGMDMALVLLDKQKQQIQFAGANNPLLQINQNGLETYKGNRFPIGRYFKEIKKPFKTHTISYQKGDAFYIFSDGYIDQLGGDNFEKYTISRLREKLLQIQNIPLDKQKEELDTTIENWIGNYIQVDDIIVVGFKV